MLPLYGLSNTTAWHMSRKKKIFDHHAQSRRHHPLLLDNKAESRVVPSRTHAGNIAFTLFNHQIPLRSLLINYGC